MALESRYYITKDGADNFPDILTYPLHKFKTTKPIKDYSLTALDLERFHYFIYNYYGNSIYRDFILLYNGIGHPYLLSAGDSILLPHLDDIKNFYKNNSIDE